MKNIHVWFVEYRCQQPVPSIDGKEVEYIGSSLQENHFATNYDDKGVVGAIGKIEKAIRGEGWGEKSIVNIKSMKHVCMAYLTE